MENKKYFYRIVRIHSYRDKTCRGELKFTHEFERIGDDLESLDDCILFLRQYTDKYRCFPTGCPVLNFRIIRKCNRRASVFNVECYLDVFSNKVVVDFS